MTVIRPVAGRLRVAQAHPVADRRRVEMRLGEWEYGLVVRAVVAGVALAAFFLALPIVGAVACLALGLDPTAGVR